jgi:hypothetical protein
MHEEHFSRTGAKRKVELPVEKLRKGIFWDHPAGQYATRVGNDIDEQTGHVRRSNVQRLGSEALRKWHEQLVLDGILEPTAPEPLLKK